MQSPPHFRILRVAATLGLLAVALGAFGAHGLENLLTHLDTTEIWKTASQYHFYHTLALLALAFAPWPAARSEWVGRPWLYGILIFSGSLYLLAVTGWRWLGAITPIGGILLLLGWLFLLHTSRKS